MLASARIPGHSGIPFFDLEHAEISQLDPALANQCFDEGVECLLHQLLGSELRQFELLGDRANDVFLGHCFGAPHGLCDSTEV